MNKKAIKYIISGVKVEERKKAEKKIAEVQKRSDKRYDWWQEEETLRKSLEEENAALKAELADAKKVIAGYKETMEQGLGIKEDDRLADLAFEKGVCECKEED